MESIILGNVKHQTNILHAKFKEKYNTNLYNDKIFETMMNDIIVCFIKNHNNIEHFKLDIDKYAKALKIDLNKNYDGVNIGDFITLCIEIIENNIKNKITIDLNFDDIEYIKEFESKIYMMSDTEVIDNLLDLSNYIKTNSKDSDLIFEKNISEKSLNLVKECINTYYDLNPDKQCELTLEDLNLLGECTKNLIINKEKQDPNKIIENCINEYMNKDEKDNIEKQNSNLIQENINKDNIILDIKDKNLKNEEDNIEKQNPESIQEIISSDEFKNCTTIEQIEQIVDFLNKLQHM